MRLSLDPPADSTACATGPSVLALVRATPPVECLRVAQYGRPGTVPDGRLISDRRDNLLVRGETMIGLVLAAVTAVSPVALLTLVPEAGDEYAVKPTPSQVGALTQRLRSGLASPAFDLKLVPQSRIPAAACADANCARRIGSSLGARTVVFGTVDRFSGIQWNAQVSALDVRSGRVLDTVSYGTLGKTFLLGDFYSLLNGFERVGACIGRSISGRAPCMNGP
jgi:hypothetical protein